ncbi:MAG: hypothetical protein ACTMIC_03460 [Cellulosimicrobium funkei]
MNTGASRFSGSTVTATRLFEFDWSPMNHLPSQYDGHATSDSGSTCDWRYVGPDMTAWPPPRSHGMV